MRNKMSREDAILHTVEKAVVEWNRTHFYLTKDTVTLDRKDWALLKEAIQMDLAELVFEIKRDRLK